MIEKILPNLYRIEVPLPNNPLKALNCYVFKGQERNLIIDTGFDREECYTALTTGLAELGVELTKTDLFITHLHADHSGLIHRIATPSSKVYASKHDGEYINSLVLNDSYWDEVSSFSGKSGFPVEDLSLAVKKHPGNRYGAKVVTKFTYVSDGDTLKVGDYTLTCIATPGHTPGVMCLYEKNHRFLLSSDHILGGITPNISLWSDNYNPLAQYLQSLDKVSKLDIVLTLPSHRQILGSCTDRIEELKRHHSERLAEVKNILQSNGEQNAYQIAGQMSWDMSYKTFEEFPLPQKWFAIGEAIAHLKYLVEQGEIQQITKNDKIFYQTI